MESCTLSQRAYADKPWVLPSPPKKPSSRPHRPNVRPRPPRRRDEYTANRVFWVPPDARWQNLQNQATRPDIATLIDDAILAVERDNEGLKNKLPRDYARRGIEPAKLKGLIDLKREI